MGGNVAEWTNDWADEIKNEKTTCGGSYLDTKDERFGEKATWSANRSDMHDWVGFRGVVRIPVE
jgi:formylglycine-generating enzyme required for sulfatase activity